MEDLREFGSLLYDFSNSIWVFRYYGYYHQARSIMNKLWKRSLKSWKDFEKGYKSGLIHSKKILRVNQGFTLPVVKYLLKNNLLLDWKLDIQITKKDQILNLTKLLKEAENSDVVFEKITLAYEDWNNEDLFDVITILKNAQIDWIWITLKIHYRKIIMLFDDRCLLELLSKWSSKAEIYSDASTNRQIGKPSCWNSGDLTGIPIGWEDAKIDDSSCNGNFACNMIRIGLKPQP
jgi:hypothetical protein